MLMVVQAEDHERRLTCEANNGLGSPLQKSFVLNVLRKYGTDEKYKIGKVSTLMKLLKLWELFKLKPWFN